MQIMLSSVKFLGTKNFVGEFEQAARWAQRNYGITAIFAQWANGFYSRSFFANRGNREAAPMIWLLAGGIMPQN
jgi:hypothetical protein